jgi:UrcA family protein
MFVRSPLVAVAAVAAAFVTTSLAVSPAAAQTAEVAVSYADLNLASPAGRAALDGRIALAARQVCAIGAGVDLKLTSQSRSCEDGAIASAAAQVDQVTGRRGTVRVSLAAN